MVRVGVIGVGEMGQHHARIYSELEGVDLVGVVDTDENRAMEVAERHKTRPFTNYKELFSEGIDAVSIVVPTTLHKAITIDALEAGVHVLVEKPISDTVESATEMIECCERAGKCLMVGHIERFNPAIVRLKEEIDSGSLGKIVSMMATRVGPYNPRIRDVGVILDLGVHDIDIMTYLYNERVSKVYASAGSSNHPHEDYGTIHLNFSNGYSGIIETNWLTPYKIRELYVVGTGGVAQVKYLDSALIIHNGRGKKELEIEREEPLKNEIINFIECVTCGKKTRINGREGRHALRVALAAIDSYKTKKIITME